MGQLGLIAALLALAPGTIASKQWVREIYRDVVIIGGGASGAYSAVRLREDYGVSVVLVEKEEILGGHVNTWIDPSTSRAFDAGVQSYIDLPGAIPFFHRFNISTVPNVRNPTSPIYVDFTTGTKLTGYSPPPTADRNGALRRYLSLCETYLPIMEPGWWSFPSPANATIPEDLLLPFQDFVTKHNLTSAVPQIFFTTGFGNHNLLSSLTMFVMRSFNADMTRVLLGLTAGFVPASKNNQDLYTAIHKFLGSDVLTSTVVTAASRSAKDGIILKVRNSQTAEITRIEAKRLLYTIPPTAENLAKFDMDVTERSVLETFKYSSSFVGIVSHPSLRPANSALINVPTSAQPANWLSSIPKSPYNARFESYPNSSYYRVAVTGDQDLSATSAKEIVRGDFSKLLASGVLDDDQSRPPGLPVEDLSFHLFEPHGRVSAYVEHEDVKNGFISRLNDLQGKRGTWYTGAAWSVHISTNLWIFTDTVLPKLVESMKDFGARG